MLTKIADGLFVVPYVGLIRIVGLVLWVRDCMALVNWLLKLWHQS
jgi:predicted membrane-bound dolichyl-phosphate-mannose-protein mannosyltransferase